MERMERVLEELETIFNLTILWKSVGTGKTSCGLSERHTYHMCAFCRKIKSEGRGLRLCSENDDVLIPRRAEAEKASFISTCHAGVSELVVPLFEGGRCTEVFLAGIFRTEKSAANVDSVEPERLEHLRILLEELSRIFRDRRDSLGKETDDADGIRDPRIRKTVDFLEKNLSRHLRIRDLAAGCCLSESRFLHLFRKETGCSVLHYLTLLRLKTARQLLELPDATIQDVMDRCGFRDQSRFGKLFREWSGFTPLVYHRRFSRRRDV